MSVEPPVETHTQPDPHEAGNAIVNARAAGNLVSVYCRCEVDYDGRAKSYLAEGDRLVQIKPDGAFLVHQTEKTEPVNWQPTGAELNLRALDDGTLKLTSRRSSPSEELTVFVSAIHHLVLYDAQDRAEQELTGTEKEMHQRIMENPEIIEEGFRALENERSVKFGSIDVFGNDANGDPVIVEVKRRRAQLSDVDQLERYMSLYREENPDARGILVAPSASDSVEEALEEKGLGFVSMEPAKTLSEASESSKLSDF